MDRQRHSLSFLNYDFTLLSEYMKFLESFLERIESKIIHYPVYETGVYFIIKGLKNHLSVEDTDIVKMSQEAQQASSLLDEIIISSGALEINLQQLITLDKKDFVSQLYIIKRFVERVHFNVGESSYKYENTTIINFLKINSSQDLKKIGELLDLIISEINQSSIIKPGIKRNIINNLEKAKKELLIGKNFLSFDATFRKAKVVCKTLVCAAGGLATVASISGYNLKNIDELPSDIDKHLYQAAILISEVEEKVESCIEINEQYAFTEIYLIEENKRLKAKEKLGALPQGKEVTALPEDTKDAPQDFGNAKLLDNDAE